jgi:uncharacterized protein YdaU (DUF1376 family)
VNYYEFHIGDYLKNTAHLSMLEDAAYRRLIDAYYTRETPLPGEKRACYKLCRAASKDEREAVDYVLDEFFVLAEDGYHNDRCDVEISRFKDKQAKAKRSADARWNKSKPHSDGNANASADAMRTHSEGNAHQSPVASRQSPDVNPLSVVASSTDEKTQPGTRKGLVCGLLRKAGMADAAPHYLTDETWELILSKRTDEEIVEVARAKMAARPGQRTGLKYIAPALLEDPVAIAPNQRGEARQNIHDQRAEVSAVLTGRTTHERTHTQTEPIDITGESERIA